MKKILFICLSAFGLQPYSNAQATLFVMGGAATNTITKKYQQYESASMAISPMGELHFYSQVFNKGKIGVVARYGNINVKESSFAGYDANGKELYTNKVNKRIVNNLYTIMMSAGAVYKIKGISLSPALELGFGFSENPTCLVMGVRFDANYEINKTVGIVAGISGDYYNFKEKGVFYIPVKAGVSFSF